MLIPDGGGALVNGEGRQMAASVRVGMYGKDGALSSSDRPQETKQPILPVFGMKRELGGFVAIVEDGDAHSFISAQTAGTNMPYNRVYSGFNILSYDTMVLKGAKKILLSVGLRKNLITGISASATFLNEDRMNIRIWLQLFGNVTDRQGVAG